MFLKHTKSLRNTILVGTALSALFICMPASAQAAEQQNFDIKPQSLSSALMDFGMQGDIEVFFVEADLKGKTTNGFEGTFSASQAATRLLADAGIAYRIDANGTLLVGKAYVRKSVAAEKAVADKVDTKDAKPARFQLAQVAQEKTGDIVAANEQVVEAPQRPEKPDEIIVTGSHIRGTGPVGSQVFIFDRKDIEMKGFTTIPQLVQSLPQNFSGGVSETTTQLSYANGALDNQDASTGINLRGLGNTATLVLLNGQRLAPSGLTGSFVDISMIPLSAIEQVEVLTDGASAIYGSDAIGGVINFKLRTDYDGAETRLRYGFATEGGLESVTIGQTLGKTWEGGHGLATYEYSHRDALDVQDRSFTKNAVQPNQLIPEQKRHSVFFTGGQELSEKIEVFATAFYNKRSSSSDRYLTLTSPPGTTSSDSKQVGGTLGGTYDLGNDWRAELVGSYSASESITNIRDIGVPLKDGRIVARESKNQSINLNLDGRLFKMWGGEAKLAIGGHYRKDSLGSPDVSDFDPSSIIFTLNADYERHVSALFAEAYLPLVGEENKLPGSTPILST